MTWFKVDDSFYDHPKVLALPLAARGLWVTAGSYAARHLTDGAVPAMVVAACGPGSQAAAKRLISAGLWEKVDTGYQFHNWQEFQPSKADVEAERRKNRERINQWRERKRNAVRNSVTNGVTNAVSNVNPVPSRPDPTSPLLTSPRSSPLQDQAGGGEELSIDAQAARDLLGCAASDERLTYVDQIIENHHPRPRRPRAWLRSVIANGDFDDLVSEARKGQEDPWAHVPKDMGGEQ